VLATSAFRSRALLAPLLVTAGGAAALVTADGLGLGLADGVVRSDASSACRPRGVSPFEHLPAVPVEPVEPVAVGPLALLVLLAAVLTAVGLLGFRGRDLG